MTLVKTVPDTLSAGVRAGLERHIEAALRQRFGASVNLRNAVRLATTEMLSAGNTVEAIREQMTRTMEDHPRRHACDRVSIVTGKRMSEVVVHQMFEWVDQACATPGGSMSHGTPRVVRPIEPNFADVARRRS